jgi:hypothetical protein
MADVSIAHDLDHTIGGSLSITAPDVDVTSTIGGQLGLVMTGDSTKPITTLVQGDPDKPVAALLTGDSTKPITTLVQGDPDKPVAALLTGDSTKPITTQLQGDPNKPIATTIDLKNLPHFSLQDIKDLKNGRVRVPNYNQFCFKVFGIEVFNWCLGGEAQVISEPYEPNAYEKCEIPCCEVDTRPFPETQKTDGHG